MKHGCGILALLACAGGAACQPLPQIAANSCGNGVIEAGESCDGFAIGESSCRPRGAPRECHLDCSAHEDGTRPRCPAGWGCDVDDVCRKATGNYHASVQAIENNAETLAAGDFDGDGRADILSEEPPGLLGATKFRVNYFGRDAQLQATSRTPFPAIGIAVAQSQSAGRADLVFTDGRVGLLLGQPDRELITGTYPTYVLPNTKVRVFEPLSRELVEGSSALLVLTEQNGVIALERPDSQSTSLRAVAQVSASLDALAGQPVVGDLFEDAQRYPCLDVALAVRGGQHVAVYSLCERDPDTGEIRYRETELNEVPLADDVTIDRGPLIADMDGDGHLDLLLGVRAADQPSGEDDRLYVAFGDGQRLLAFEALQARIDGRLVPIQVPMPIAAGDFNGDRFADLVNSDGFLLSRPSARAAPLFHNVQSRLGSAWSEAKIADFNGNGLPDVAASSLRNADIGFFNGTGSDLMNEFVVPTARPVEHLVSGDFDGDLIADLAFAVTGAPDEAHELVVAFGSSQGPPSAPTTVARVAGVVQLGVLPYDTSSSLDGLSVTYERITADGPESALAQFANGGDRRFLCGIELTNFAADGSLITLPALALTLGAFTHQGRLDALLFGSNVPSMGYGMWLLPELESSDGRPENLGWEFDPEFTPLRGVPAGMNMPLMPGSTEADNPEISVRLAAGDLDHDGLDELVAAAPDAAGQRCFVASAHIQNGVAGTRSLHVDGSVTLDRACGAQSQLTLHDLDGDDELDALLLLGGGASRHELLVLWNDGHGGFSRDALTTIELAGDDPRAFAAFEPTRDARASVAYVTQNQLRVLRGGGHARSFKSTDPKIDALVLGRATGIAAADIDGDGVTDLVVADDGNLRVLRAELAP